MARVPRPHPGIMAALMPFVILLLILIALDPAPARPAPAPAFPAVGCPVSPIGATL